MRIAFDVGGVLSKYPEVFRPLVQSLIDGGGTTVYVVSDMHPKAKILDMLQKNGFIPPIDVALVYSSDYQTHGEMCKAILCQELGIDILVDDHMGYVSIPGSPLVRLLVMSDPTLPYYATAQKEGAPHWHTDGSEGDFGRRNPAGSKRPPEDRMGVKS